MDYEQVNFTNILDADGLTADESLMLKQLVSVFNDRLHNNRMRMDAYEDKIPLANIGLSIPRDIASKVDTSNGLAAIAVDYLSSRSIFDSFTTDDGISAELNRVLDENDFAIEYAKAVPSQLVHGVGFWTVTAGEQGKGESASIINYHNATSAAALWDFRRKRIKCGFVVEDYELVQYLGKEVYQPSLVVLHTDYAVIELEKRGDEWTATRKPNMLGRPLMVAMPYRPQDTKPLGRSRVSKPVLGICASYSREILRMELHSELFASGQKAILGVSDEQFTALQGNKYRAAMSELFIATRDENGDIPQVTQFAQQSMEPHIKAMEMLLARLSAETSIPIAAFGISDKGRTSSEALAASYGDLIIEAENLNRNNGKAILEVAKLALAVATNRTLDKLTDDEKTLQVHWIDPAMPSAASVADATVKLASAVPEFGGTEIFWELNGFNEEQRRRVRAEMIANKQTEIAASVLGA